MLRLWLLRLMPFLGRWLEVVPACCGGCPTCATAGITGLTLEVLGSKPPDDSGERQAL
jgi:hypothetical protein